MLQLNKYLLILFFLLLSVYECKSMLHHSANAKNTNSVPVNISFTDPIVTGDSSTCIIPFSRAGNLIIVRAKADSAEGNFILDTGAPCLVLNITYFRNYPSSVKEGETGGITGSTSSVLQTKIDSFSLGAFKYYKVDADLANLGHIEDKKGIKILGLLGMELFKKFEMVIDYEKNIIYLHLISKKDKNNQHEILRDTAAYSVYPIEIYENKILTWLYNAGKKLRFVIDTGAETNVLDSRSSNKVLDNVVVTGRVLLSGTSNKKVEALNGDLLNSKIGNDSVNVLPVLVTNLKYMCYSYDTCLNGMLGFDFLSLHKIGFNFVTRKMYIWK